MKETGWLGKPEHGEGVTARGSDQFKSLAFNTFRTGNGLFSHLIGDFFHGKGHCKLGKAVYPEVKAPKIAAKWCT